MNVLQIQIQISLWQEEQIYIYMQEKTRNDILSLIEITQNQK